MTIVLRNFRIEETGAGVEAVCDIVSDRLPAHLRYGTDRDRVHYLDIDQPNWAAVALFYPAMMFGEELVIEADLSPRLLYNLRNDLMTLFGEYEPCLKPISIKAGMPARLAAPVPDTRGVATGFSGGVDSFCTTMIYDNAEVPDSLRLDTLAVFDVGAFGRTGAELTGRKFAHGCEIAREYAAVRGYEHVTVSSNMDDIFAPVAAVGPADFVKTVGLRNVSAALLLQRGLKTYLPSSSVHWTKVSCGAGFYTGQFEPVSLPLLSTESLHLQSAGAGLSRKDKQMLIADNPDVHTRLNVCVQHDRLTSGSDFLNCGRCWKCLQTKTIYEAEGALDRFGAVFDLDDHRRNHADLMQEMADIAAAQGIGEQAVADARAAGIHVPRPSGRLRKWYRAQKRKAGNRGLPHVWLTAAWGLLKSFRRRLIRGRKLLFRRLGLRQGRSSGQR